MNSFNNLLSSKFFRVFVWDVLSKGADFLFLPIYLKILSPQEYGFYTYLIYIIVTIAGIIKLGLDTSVSKLYFEQDKYDRGQILFSVNIVWILFFFLVVSVGLITGLDVRLFTELMTISMVDYNEVKFFILVFIFFSLIQATLNVFFVIDDNALIYQKYNLVRTIGGNIIVISLISMVETKNKAYLRIYIEPIIFLLSFVPLVTIFVRRMVLKINWDIIKNSLAVGLPMMGTQIVAIVYNITDKYYLQKTSGLDTLAVYNLAIFLTLPISLIFMSFNTVWLPKFFQEKSNAQNIKQTNKYFIQLFLFFFGVMIIIQIVVVIGLKFEILYKYYQPIIYIFPIVFISKIADTLLQLYNNFIISWGKTIFNLTASFMFAIITLSLNYKLIPIWGLDGAITILLLISIIRLTIFYLFVKYHLKYEFNTKV